MITDFIDALTEIIKERFGVLDESYIDDLLVDVKKDAERELDAYFTVRYVLIDGETGQLESRTLFAEEKAAEEAAQRGTHGKSCRLAVVFLDN